MARQPRAVNVAVTGVAELDQALLDLVDEVGAKGINAVMRKACREAVKDIVKPAVIERMPWETGFLESQIVVKAAAAGRGKISFYVGFKDPLFQGDTFYGGFIEFGWNHRLGMRVEADSFLRAALYPNTQRVIGLVHSRVKQWVDLNNRLA